MRGLSIESSLRRLFPRGTNPDRAADGVDEMPAYPADVFAAAAFLLERSGAYQYIVAVLDGSGAALENCEYDPPTGGVTIEQIASWTELGRKWREAPEDCAGVKACWSALLEHRDKPLVVSNSRLSGRPDWWSIAHSLLIIADEASDGVGYFDPKTWIELAARTFAEVAVRRSAIVDRDGKPDPYHLAEHGPLDTIAFMADRHVARVLPKGRTPDLGCTMRTMSHNLALLPPLGEGRAYWQHVDFWASKPDRDPLNLLLVPFPYRIRPNCFHGVESEGAPTTLDGEASLRQRRERWGRFKVFQRWLNESGEFIPGEGGLSDAESRERIVDFVLALLAEARRDCEAVHGLVFPEYALDWPTYNALVAALRDKASESDLKFLVAGVSEDCGGSSGNIAVYTVFGEVDRSSEEEGGPRRGAVSRSRRKHHRWRLDADQIETYGLASALNPSVKWWEFLEVGEREMHFVVFRQKSTFTVMICEDLARADPAHAFLRSLGPNLVFVLLMDGPQTRTRWPARYATVVADDPGSSVLTLTSYGLVERSNHNRRDGSESVALWKDDTGQVRELACPRSDHAVLLTLSGREAKEFTLDARPNVETCAWRYHGHRTIRLAGRKMKDEWAWIVGD